VGGQQGSRVISEKEETEGQDELCVFSGSSSEETSITL